MDTGESPDPPRPSGAAMTIDADGMVAGWTDGARRLLGYPAGEVVGRPAVDLLVSPADGVGGTDFTRPLFPRTGERRTVRWRHHEGHSLDLAVCFSRLALRDGQAGWLLAITDAAVDDSRLALLSEAGARIGTTLDVLLTAQELADFAVPRIADYVTVDLAESVPLGEEPLTRLDPDAGRIAAFHRAGVASIHDGIPESLWSHGEPVFVPPQSPFTRVLASGRPYFEPVLDKATWLVLDPERSQVMLDTGMHSVMMVPIRARGTTLGIAVFVRTDNPAPFQEDDLLLAEEIVSRAALSLDSASRYTREHTAALALQRNMLPRRLSGGAALEISFRYHPADLRFGVGGDWYDVIALPHGRTALVVGDVIGHGLNAAATMGRLSTTLRTLALLDLPPDEVLTHLDQMTSRLMEQQNADAPTVVTGGTCLYAVYDPVRRRLEVARAGHPPPLLVDPDGRATFPDIPAGVPIGTGLPLFDSAELDIAEGTLVALYTDGLVERRTHDIDVGMERLATVLARPGAPLEQLSSAAIDTMCPKQAWDDATLLLARSRAPAHPAPSPSSGRTG